jgi:hypothetical protein
MKMTKKEEVEMGRDLQDIDKERIKAKLARLDWIKILDNAIKSRPTSWNDNPVREWRNASDEVYMAVIHAMEDIGILNPLFKKKDDRIRRTFIREEDGNVREAKA